MEKLFENIGEKIKTLAKVVFVIVILISAIGGLAASIALGKVMHGFAFLVCLGSIVVGIIASYISSMFLYGFGELISNSQKMVDNGNAPKPDSSNITGANHSTDFENAPVVNDTVKAQADLNKAAEKEAEPGLNEWKCPQCGRIHQNYVGTCGCGGMKP